MASEVCEWLTLRKALEAPAKTIAQNAGFDGSVVVNKIRNGKGAHGFNADTGEYTDLVKAGVIDPAKVTKNALQNAASVATLCCASPTFSVMRWRSDGTFTPSFSVTQT